MLKNTTESLTAGRRTARGRASATALLALLAALLLGCTTAQPRESPTNILGNLRFRDAKAADLFQRSHRAGNLYSDFRPLLVIDALPLDPQYRRLYLDMLKERYLLPEAEVAKLRDEQTREFSSAFELIVLAYGGSNEPVNLEKAGVGWRVLLRDDDGELLAPSSIEKVRADSATFRYVGLYFDGLDRWSQMYRVRFPKLEKSLIGKAIGSKPVQLVVTGVAGAVVLEWADPMLFYSPTAAKAGP
jgi:hypothetical protein